MLENGKDLFLQNIEAIEKNKLHIVTTLAKAIWPKAYGDILSAAQIDYMLDKMYDVSVLEKRQESGHIFLLIKNNETPVGFAEMQCNSENNFAKLHKIYVLPEMQGKHFGKQLLEAVVRISKNQSQSGLYLNVNRNNKAVYFYKKYGFCITKEEDIDIGNGYFMNDFVMHLTFH